MKVELQIRRLFKLLFFFYHVVTFVILQQVVIRLSTSARHKFIKQVYSVLIDTPLNEDDLQQSIHGTKLAKMVIRMMYLDIFKDARIHCKAPNTEVVMLDGKTRKRILDFQKKDRPLILNFGSCT